MDSISSFHKIAEDSAEHISKWPDRDKGTVTLALDVARGAHKFKFDFIADPKFRDFARECLESGINVMPFDQCLFEFLDNRPGAEGRENDRTRVAVLLLKATERLHAAEPPEPGNIRLMVAYVFWASSDLSNLWVPVGTTALAIRDGELSYRSAVIGPRPHLTESDRGDIHMEMMVHCNMCIAYMGALSSKVVEKRESADPAKLNAKRARSKKEPVYGVISVQLSPGVRAGKRSDHEGSGRASPIMHLRRGHVRRAPHSERLIPIPPCIVNGDEGSELVREYRVRNSGG